MPFLKNLNHDSRAVPKIKPEELKASILQYAIEGRLVEQRAEEGTAEELYKQIQAEKQKLVKEGKIKKEKPLPEIKDDEIHFDIPKSWKLCRLGDCIDLLSGQDLPSNRYGEKNEGIVYLTGASNIDNSGNLIINRWTTSPTSVAKKGSLLLTCKGTVGKTYVLDIDEAHIARQIMAITYILGDIGYLRYFIEISISNLQSKAKSMIPGIDRNSVRELMFPLPPLAEQRRIVAKIEELLPYVDRYAEAYERLEEFNAKFPEEMKKSILQYAIEGRLVEQRAEEGTAEELYKQIQSEKQKLIKEGKIKKEKPLPEISEKEIPFDIPESWKWVKFGQIMINRDAERIPLSVSEREKLKKIYDYYGASGVIDKVDNYLFDKKLLLIGEDGANLLSRSTPIAFLAEGKYWVNNHAHVLDCNRDLICIEYIMYFINAISLAPYVTGTAQPKMNQEKMNSIPVSLPPLAEQRRIVAKIEELLPLCERLAECREKA